MLNRDAPLIEWRQATSDKRQNDKTTKYIYRIVIYILFNNIIYYNI